MQNFLKTQKLASEVSFYLSRDLLSSELNGIAIRIWVSWSNSSKVCDREIAANFGCIAKRYITIDWTFTNIATCLRSW